MYDFYILGVVGQEPVLFDCSIMENIKYIYISIFDWIKNMKIYIKLVFSVQ